MKEELTTKMHSEFIGHEISDFDLRIMSVFGAVRGGMSLKEALKEDNILGEEYLQNIDRVIGVGTSQKYHIGRHLLDQ